jgi:hypothetical protein
MDKLKLSEMYAIATTRVAEATTTLYESLHNEKGEPLTMKGQIADRISSYQKEVMIELDLIKQSSLEFRTK